MLRCVEGVDPAVERSAVVSVAELVVLPGVDEFVPDDGTGLLPTVLFVGLPSQRNRDLLCCRVVLCDARLSLRLV